MSTATIKNYFSGEAMSEFKNEVPIDSNDKVALVRLLTEANHILNKYPFQIYGTGSHTVTSMTRAKEFAQDALKWSQLL